MVSLLLSQPPEVAKCDLKCDVSLNRKWTHTGWLLVEMARN